MLALKQLPKTSKSKNPNNPSPSGDTWFDDPQNLAAIEEGLKSKSSGVVIRSKKELNEFLDGL